MKIFDTWFRYPSLAANRTDCHDGCRHLGRRTRVVFVQRHVLHLPWRKTVRAAGIAPAINNPGAFGRVGRQLVTARRSTVAAPARGMPTWVPCCRPVRSKTSLRWSMPGARVRRYSHHDRRRLADQALFALSQKDDKDALFYLNRAKPLAFGPGLAQLDPIVATDPIWRSHQSAE